MFKNLQLAFQTLINPNISAVVEAGMNVMRAACDKNESEGDIKITFNDGTVHKVHYTITNVA